MTVTNSQTRFHSNQTNWQVKLRLVSILFFAFILNAWSQNIPQKPNPARLVNDYGDLLSDNEEGALEQKLRNYHDTTSNQVAIVTIQSLEGYDIESYSYKLATEWGIGQKTKNNGILILIAAQEHKMRIEVGYGLEGAVTDAATKQVIRDVMKPAFKQGNYYGGLDQATDYIIKFASGEYKAEPTTKGKSGGKALIFIIIIIIFIVISFISKVNRVRGSNIGNNSLSLWTILALLGSGGNDRHRGGGGGFGGGSSGGGFGGFGGGGFGGGGSSGDW